MGGGDVDVEAMGSVAYKLARVACGLADATWTLVPKHEWDVAAGVALIHAAGGWAKNLQGEYRCSTSLIRGSRASSRPGPAWPIS